jgi:hypothetical protein
MNQRGVTILATYLEKRCLGRMVRVRPVGDDDFIVAIEDLRDGRTGKKSKTSAASALSQREKPKGKK